MIIIDQPNLMHNNYNLNLVTSLVLYQYHICTFVALNYHSLYSHFMNTELS